MLFVFGASKDLEQDEKEEAKAMFKSSLDDLMLLVLGSVFDVFGKSLETASSVMAKVNNRALE